MPIMLTFMNSKIAKMTGKDKQKHIFQKLKSYDIQSADIYIIEYTYIYIYIYIYIFVGEDQEFIHVFY